MPAPTDRLAALARRPALAALGLGAASALALPPVHAVPVLLLTLPGFLGLIGRETSWKRAAWLGFCFGFGHHLAGLYWVTHALFTDIGRWFWLVPVAAPGLALPLALFSVIPAVAAWRAAPGLPRALAFAGAWVLAELARGVLFTGFPWNLLGTAWAFAAWPIQAASLFGTHFLSFVTVLAACLPSLRDWRAVGAAAALVALLLGYGGWRMAGGPPPPEAVRIVVVQGNIAQDLKWDEDQRLPIFQRYVALTQLGAQAAAQAHPEAPVVAVWPETASPYLLTQDPDAIRLAASALPPRGLLLAGTVRAQWTSEGRVSALYNSLAAVTALGEFAGVYDKHHLVPFGEYMPLGGLLPIRMVTGGVDFSAGPGPRTVALPGVPPVSPLICYEVIFPGAVVASENRPAWLLNVTNDAWFGVSAGPFQHLAAARLRAVEEGLPLVRAAQTGISAIFDSQGRVVARMGLMATGTLGEWLPGAGPPTLFSRLGLIPILGLSGLSLAFGLGFRRGRGRLGD
ncbi:MAG: apolipoprotein N-acyltransferase [Acetobacteraceae bacterium]|nr:apolipoprotein N-acyltransferase [Acetobacteraceae bacterium]